MAEEKNFQQKAEEFCGGIVKSINYDRLEIWKNVFFHPSSTFEGEMEKADLARGAKDVFISHLPMLGITFIFLSIMLVAFSGLLLFIAPLMIVAMLLGVLIYFALPVIGWLLGSAVYFVVARLLGGKGSFRKHAYLIALSIASTTVFSLPFALLAFIPCIGYLGQAVSLVIGFYLYYLTFRAIKLVHGLSRKRAMITVVLPLVLMIALLAAVYIAVIVLQLGLFGATQMINS